MGISLSGIHIFGGAAPVSCGFSFRSFSPNWQTCTDDFSGKAPDYPYKAAKLISRHTGAPVLHFGVFGSNSEIRVLELKNSGHYYYEKDDLSLIKEEFKKFLT